MEFSIIPGRIQIGGWLNPVEYFRKKVIPFEVLPFSRFYQNYRKLMYYLSTLTSARLFTVILPRKSVKDLKDGGRFPKRLPMQWASFLIGNFNLGDLLEHNCNPAGD